MEIIIPPIKIKRFALFAVYPRGAVGENAAVIVAARVPRNRARAFVH